MNTAVSVIIPVYNTEKYIEECLRSILGQTLKDIEVICVDDGSTDSSPEIIKKITESYDNVHLLRQQNLYAGVARNNGMDIANGKYLLFMDSDDFLEPNALELAVDAAEKQRADITVFSGYIYDDATGENKLNESYLKIGQTKGLSVFSRKEIPEHILTFTNPAPWNKLYRKDFVFESGLRFQELKYANDVYFTKMAAIKANRITCVNKPLIHYRTGHLGNLQKKKFKDPYKYLDALRKLYTDINEMGVYEEVSTSFIDYALSMLSYEMKPYRYKPDRIDVYNTVLSDKTIRAARVLEADPKVLNNKSSFYYIKGLEAACNLYNRKEEKDDSSLLVCESRSEEPFFSIIISNYNKKEYIADCINSLEEQTFKDFEIVLIDDGSTDGSTQLVTEIAKNNDRITLLTQQNQGLSCSRNKGIEYAKGRFLLFLDADDILKDTSLESLRSRLDADTDMMLFNAEAFLSASESKEMLQQTRAFNDWYRRKLKYDGWFSGVELLDRMVTNDEYLSNACFYVISNRYIREKGLRFEPKILHEDILFTFCALLYAEKVGYLDEVLYLRRVVENSIMTSKATSANVDGCFTSYHKMMNIINEIKDRELYTDHIYGIYALTRIVLKNTRKYYENIPKEQQLFYLAYESPMDADFEALVADYCKRNEELKKKKRNYDRISVSSSYKIGRMITAVPRKIRMITKKKDRNILKRGR